MILLFMYSEWFYVVWCIINLDICIYDDVLFLFFVLYVIVKFYYIVVFYDILLGLKYEIFVIKDFDIKEVF